MRVQKRNGTTQVYDDEKIYNAIMGAVNDIGEPVNEEIVKRIVKDITTSLVDSGEDCVNIETIQDMVEDKLMNSSLKNVAKQYIKYRYNRERVRDSKSALMQRIKEKLFATNVENQNANLDERSFSGRQNEANRVVMKEVALEDCMSEMAVNNHVNNRVYEHDLDSFAAGMTNCLSIPYDSLLRDGCKTKQCSIRPAQSISSASQLIAVIMQLQSLQQFGGVAATHIDETLVPFVKKSFKKHYVDGLLYIDEFEPARDRGVAEKMLSFEIEIGNDTCYDYCPAAYNYAMDMTKRDTYQAIEALIHNLNTLQSRSGQQLPFSSINYGVSTSPEGRMSTEAILKVSINGIGQLYTTPIFPCGIFQSKKGVNRKPGDPNYDLFKLALKSTARRLYPNYVNCDWSVDVAGRMLDVKNKRETIANLSPEDLEKLTEWVKNNPKTAREYKLVLEDDKVVVDENIILPEEITSTMGCRTYNGYDINFDFGYIVRTILETGNPPKNYFHSGNQKDGRGNACPVTIILPTLAMEAKELSGDVVDNFMDILDRTIHEAKDMLIERYEWMCAQAPESARFMYENNTCLGYIPEEGIRSALKHFTLVIGQLGLAEALQILIGTDHTTEEGMALAKQIEQLFKDRCSQFKNNLKLNFGVYYTPAENLCYTALKKFRDKYGVIPNVSDREFFTNSMHVPVWKEMSPFEKIDIESQLTGYSSGGCITYVELESSAQHNIEALEELVNYAMDKDIPYFAINLPNDTCNDCGFTGEFNDECPMCGSKNITQLRRVTGYLTADYKTTFNDGKIDEVEHRVKHNQIIE